VEKHYERESHDTTFQEDGSLMTEDGYPMPEKRGIRGWLERAPIPVLTLYAGVFAFATYFCMYAFRKPFSAAKYQGLKFLGTGIDLKTAFVISQIIGYTFSKYIGIKLCSEATPQRRFWLLFGTILWAEAALLLFAIVPQDLKAVALFLNGLPLGMVWGLVVWYLEGRRTSEVMLTILSCSYILSSAVVKDVGSWLMSAHGITEYWMPFVAGLLFLPGFAIAGLMLHQMPSPSATDVKERVERVPMNGQQRWEFLRLLWVGLLPLLIMYFFLTAFRDYRDNYGAELFAQLGYDKTPGKFTRAELPVAFLVMAVLATLSMVRDNRRGLLTAFGIMSIGLLMVGGAMFLLDTKAIDGALWMTLIGLGSYLAYVPFGSVVFDRMVAATRIPATAVFTIYLADAIGYTGSVGTQLYKDLFMHNAGRLEFFRTFSYAMAVGGVALMAMSAVFFARRTRQAEAVVVEPV
jgi:hypothetical protein